MSIAEAEHMAKSGRYDWGRPIAVVPGLRERARSPNIQSVAVQHQAMFCDPYRVCPDCWQYHPNPAALRSAAFIRPCQPLPVARKLASTSGSGRRVTAVLVTADFGRPRWTRAAGCGLRRIGRPDRAWKDREWRLWGRRRRQDRCRDRARSLCWACSRALAVRFRAWVGCASAHLHWATGRCAEAHPTFYGCGNLRHAASNAILRRRNWVALLVTEAGSPVVRNLLSLPCPSISGRLVR